MDDSLWYGIKHKHGTNHLDAGIIGGDTDNWELRSRTGAAAREEVIEWQPFEWMNEALCAGLPLDMFFPKGGQVGNKMRAAVRMCRACPVQPECLDYARKTKSQGIWGGILFGKEREIEIAV